MSFAYCGISTSIQFMFMPLILGFFLIAFARYSTIKMKRFAEMGQPCLIALVGMPIICHTCLNFIVPCLKASTKVFPKIHVFKACHHKLVIKRIKGFLIMHECMAVCEIMSMVDLILLTVERPVMHSDWSLDIISPSTLCSLIAKAFANIYSCCLIGLMVCLFQDIPH